MNIRNQELKNVLANSNIYTEFREFKKPKYLPPIRTYGENYLWEADLMFFTHPSFSEENDGYLYILAIIDTFTRKVKMHELKSKNTTEVTNCVKNLFKNEKPKKLQVTEVAVADELASAAELVMGKSTGVPVAILRGVDPEWFGDGSVKDDLLRKPNEDLFR